MEEKIEAITDSAAAADLSLSLSYKSVSLSNYLTKIDCFSGNRVQILGVTVTKKCIEK